MKRFHIALCLESITTTVIQNEELKYKIIKILIISLAVVNFKHTCSRERNDSLTLDSAILLRKNYF